jgi:hypothetical protein
MNIQHKIERYEREVEEINAQLDAKKTADFESEKAALKWYEKQCKDRKILLDQIKKLKYIQSEMTPQGHSRSSLSRHS